MRLMLDSFWRAALYCLHPRVILLSLLPLVLMIALGLGLGYLFWDAALASVHQWLESWSLLQSIWSWLEGIGLGGLKAAVGPLIVIFLVTPVIVVSVLLTVAWLMSPTLLRLVGERRFAHLEKRQGGGLIGGMLWALWSSLMALLALLVSVPLWLIPPLVLVLPPLIWGWLTYRVMAYDALALHATKDERRAIFKRHHAGLLGIGVLTGYLGAAPGFVWASGAMLAAAFVILVPLAIWIYTLVFAFSSLWFAHYTLAALDAMRQEQSASAPRVDGGGPMGATPATAGATSTAATAPVDARTVEAVVTEVAHNPSAPAAAPGTPPTLPSS